MHRSIPAFVLAFALAAGCAQKQTAAPARTETTPAPPTPLERYFPIEEGKIYQYATHENDTTGMLVLETHRTDRTHGELRRSNGTNRFVFDESGIQNDRGAYLLKSPLDVDASWAGEHGGTTRVSEVDVAVTVPAGSYASCIRTTEEAARARYLTTYCPGVGMVALAVTAPSGEAGAELRSYGARIKIQGEGLHVERP